MKYNPEIHHRRSIRLKGYDYSQNGAYFITICAHERVCLFGEIINDKMILNNLGILTRDEWIRSAEIRTEIVIDNYIIMPNHLHSIVIIHNKSDQPAGRPYNGPEKSIDWRTSFRVQIERNEKN